MNKLERKEVVYRIISFVVSSVYALIFIFSTYTWTKIVGVHESYFEMSANVTLVFFMLPSLVLSITSFYIIGLSKDKEMLKNYTITIASLSMLLLGVFGLYLL